MGSRRKLIFLGGVLSTLDISSRLVTGEMEIL
jgi:hypothetical protein